MSIEEINLFLAPEKRLYTSIMYASLDSIMEESLEKEFQASARHAVVLEQKPVELLQKKRGYLTVSKLKEVKRVSWITHCLLGS